MKTNYDLKMQQIVNNLEGKPKLLLHSCCAPCSSSVISRIKELFDITVVYYNPNIYPENEYLKRKTDQIRLLKLLNVKFLDCDYNEQEFLSQVVGLEAEKEGGARCPKCFMLRLKYTAQKAKELGFDYFGTTLTISPHKNEQIINLLGESLEKDINVKFLYSDFKKHNGYLNSIKLSKEYNLYRQDYCGCRYSLRNN
ncbi:MAG: epoxyqueuosine reductase QueH [Clostridiales bacterium]|nr:epoxyqueuosine reductase QueH [Clostridiales bacterium]